jgi:hypothetical protein
MSHAGRSLAWAKTMRFQVVHSAASTALSWIQDVRDLVEIAPRPIGGRQRTHYRMARFMKMAGRMLPWRGIAATYMAACFAFAKRNPKISLFQTFLAGAGRARLWEIVFGKPLQVFTNVFHESLRNDAVSDLLAAAALDEWPRLSQIEQKNLGVIDRADVQIFFIGDGSAVACIERLAIKCDGAARHLQPCLPPRL